jgi:hypothetical protein
VNTPAIPDSINAALLTRPKFIDTSKGGSPKGGSPGFCMIVASCDGSCSLHEQIDAQ